MSADPAPAPLLPCTRCQTPLEAGDLRCAICALPVPSVVRPESASAYAQVLRCTECGAAVAFSPAAQAPHCAFCGATMVVEQPVDPIEVAERRVPFAVDRAAAETALRGWLGARGWFAPSTLRDEAVLEAFHPLAWAAWVVDARAQVAWTADSDAGHGRAQWAPHSGQLPLSFDGICVPATRGLTPAECAQLIPHYDLARAQPIAPAHGDQPATGEQGEVVESFDAQRSAARATIQAAIESTAKVRVQPAIPGSRYRNIHVSCLLEAQSTERIALPAWVLAYRYRGTPYRAIVHGQRADIVFGSSPKDWRKILLVVGGIVALFALAAILGIVLAR